MSARLLDGTSTAAAMRAEVRAAVADLAAHGLRPGLGVILAGSDPASAVYVRAKTRACADAGLHSETVELASDVTTDRLLAEVDGLNGRADVHGILVQLPLPRQVDAQRVLDAVLPEKDVDGFHPVNAGRLCQKRPRFVACTPAGIMELLRRHDVRVAGRRAVVVGRSDIVGKPMALLLLHADATVTVCHSRTPDLPAVTREADILVVAIGRPGLIGAEHVKPGAAVVDVGVHRIGDECQAAALLPPERLPAFRKNGSALVGDVRFAEVREVAGALTPVPGGVGPLTIAQLLRNTLQAAVEQGGAGAARGPAASGAGA